MLDRYLYGDVSRVCPEAPVPVVDLQTIEHTAGGAGNVVANLSSLGGTALTLGLVGIDEEGEALLALLQERGACVAGLLRDASRPTSVKNRVMARNQQMLRLDRETRTPVNGEMLRSLKDACDEAVAAADVVILSDYAKGLLVPELCQYAIARALALGKPCIVDPKGNDCQKYRSATGITPNLNELSLMLRTELQSDDDIVEAATVLLPSLAVEFVLVKKGPKGMSLFERGGEPRHISARAAQVFDVTGAGDTVIAALALALAAGASYYEAAVIANEAAGVVVSKPGTAMASAEEILARLPDAVQ
jgi:D-beta-D-heptose 7-phosphate kinase/D-beta-D-heptose 1-phosphate adenosyltransferase